MLSRKLETNEEIERLRVAVHVDTSVLGYGPAGGRRRGNLKRKRTPEVLIHWGKKDAGKVKKWIDLHTRRSQFKTKSPV